MIKTLQSEILSIRLTVRLCTSLMLDSHARKEHCEVSLLRAFALVGAGMSSKYDILRERSDIVRF